MVFKVVIGVSELTSKIGDLQGSGMTVCEVKPIYKDGERLFEVVYEEAEKRVPLNG